MSDIWKFFDKIKLPEKLAKCKLCGAVRKRTDGSTKGMWQHLEIAHVKEYNELKNSSAEGQKKEQVYSILHKYKIHNI
jgi:hypothetical protein